MLLVDYRDGSKDLIAPLTRMGLPVEEADLESGDVCFLGRGEKGAEVTVGVEFKTMRECVAAIRTERLQGFQMGRMRDHFDYSWLLVEGETLFDKIGRLMRRTGARTVKPLPGGMGVSEYYKRHLVMHLCGGLNPVYTQNRAQTLKWIEALYRTWTDADLDKHKSHLAIYQAPALEPISPTQAALKAWPGLGMKGSAAAERKFGSVRVAANAKPSAWAALETVDDKGHTRRLGENVAQTIDTFLEGK